VILGAPAALRAQTPAPASAPLVLTLDQAIQYAIDHYPTVRAALEQVNAATAVVAAEQSAYLPRLDSIWQSNRATANNVFGQLLPQSVIPALSGPVLPSASAHSVWGSAAGALLSWEPIDFGRRNAMVSGAEAAIAQARAGKALTELDVQRAVASAFLDVVAARRAVVAAQADVDRRDTLGRAVHVLVDNQLRPGAEASRADAELAGARTRVARAQQSLVLAQTMLTRMLGATGAVTIADANLLDALPAVDVGTAANGAHPLAQVRQAAIDAALAEQEVLSRTDLPRLYLESSVFARGSGASPAGALDGGIGGLGLDRVNWAAGVQVVFPNVFDFWNLRARKTAAAATERAQVALYDEALLTITSERQAASAMLQAARAVAANTPVQLAAAQQSEVQARARYQAGLTNIVEIADAESLLAQAELEEQVARVDVWRALLAEAVAAGTLTPFLTLVHP
jgi:outer membrane protein TolC